METEGKNGPVLPGSGTNAGEPGLVHPNSRALLQFAATSATRSLL